MGRISTDDLSTADAEPDDRATVAPHRGGTPSQVLRRLTDEYATETHAAMQRAAKARDAADLERVGAMLLLLAQTEREYADLTADAR